MEILNKSWIINIVSNSKEVVSFDANSNAVKIGDLDVTYPWEFEKSGVLLEVKEYNGILFYSFTVDSKHLVIISNDEFEMKEEIMSFFGDVDVLVIIWTKKWAEIFENIEARVVVPYWPTKQIFLATLGQNEAEVDSYKVKGDMLDDVSEFVNLAE
jgi:hypothetical protein